MEEQTVTLEERQSDYIRGLIDKDADLPTAERKMFKKMAKYFALNFQDNLTLTSMDLSVKYGVYTPDQWRDFLNYPAMYKYIDQYKTERMKQIADQAMLSGDSNGIKLRAELDRAGGGNYNNLIILRLPDRDDNIDDTRH